MRSLARTSAGIIAAVGVCMTVVTASQVATPEPAYVERGHRTEAQQRVLKTRLERFHEALETALREAAPDLLPQLEPPPSPVPGYQILPRLTPDATAAPSKAQVVSYSWGWSDKLMANETAYLADTETALAGAAALPSAERHARYEDIIHRYRKVVDDRRMIDSDINYNWLWQESIHTRRASFDAMQRALDAAYERDRLEAALASGDETGMRATLKALVTPADSLAHVREVATARVEALTRDVNAHNGLGGVRDYVVFSQPAPDEWLLTVPFYTDIQDAAFVEAFRTGMEERWRADETVGTHTRRFRVHVRVTTLTPAELYCGTAAPRSGCMPPAPGDHIDVDAHVAKFPADGGVLTTGSAALRFVGVGGIALSASDVSLRVLAHEFGHSMGFPDAYFRGYADMGPEGYRITEFGAPGDIMSAPGTGPVLPRHFQMLLGAKASEWLNRSLSLYQEHRYDESRTAARRALDFRADYAPAWNNVAAASASLGLWDDAIAAADEALRLDPTLALARNNRAWAAGERAKGQAR